MRFFLLFSWFLTTFAVAQGTRADYERAASLSKRTEGKVFRAKVSPRWLPDGNGFWYRIETAPGVFEVVHLDAINGTRTVVTDPKEIPGANAGNGPLERGREPRPSRNGGDETAIRFHNESVGNIRLFWLDTDGERKPYGEIRPGATHAQHTFVGHVWLVEDEMGRRLGVFEGIVGVGEVIIDGSSPPEQPKAAATGWTPFLREFNVWLRRGQPKEEVQVSRDGTADAPYREPILISPDGTKLVALRVHRVSDRKVWVIESSPQDQLQPKLQSYSYPKPGDEIDRSWPMLFDLEARKPVPIKEDLFPNPWSIVDLRWLPDGKRFAFIHNQRGHQRQHVVAIDGATGTAQVLVEEASSTFVDYSQKTYLKWLKGGDEFLWASERDGWNHLWLCDARSGQIKNQVTRGEWVVREVVRVDEERRQVWFKALGIRSGEDPYYAHLARVNFDGTGLTVLTEGDGTHEWEFSPDGRWILDRWSRVDLPPVTELRNADDGKLVCVVERAEAESLLETGWRMPERFSAKGRDGNTDIFGVIYRPSNFDPAKTYPVIEKIYAGPHDFFVPKKWGVAIQPLTLAELGFIVVQIDGMGTNWRSRAFHDICWKNLKDAGIPDRIAWLKAAAARFPEMDLTRVGIFGGSAGGQNALAALLFHRDFYKAAAADCGCHDNRMDKIWWNEAWMGWPVGPEYAASSNVVHAGKLTGKLLLTVGEIDHNVDPASTMQVVDALIKADKDFEMLVLPGRDHGAGETPYAARRRADFFVRHLLGVEPRSR